VTVSDRPVSSLAASLGGSDPAAEQLALGVAQREASSLQRFYESHVDGLYGFVMVRVRGDAALAEDVVQDTFLEAIDRARSYDPQRGSLRAWLLTLSRNVLRRHLRHHPKRRDLVEVQRNLDASWAELGAALRGTPPSDEILEREETRQLVTAAIASLQPKYRRVLERKYVDECSLADLAGQLELSGEAVKSRLARARRAFRRAFLELCEEARSERQATGEAAAGPTEAP